MDQWDGQQRAFAIKIFYKNNDSLEGFSKVPFFLCHPVSGLHGGDNKRYRLSECDVVVTDRF